MSDSVRCDLPDTIIGIGKGGKSILYKLMRTDWILTEVLEPRQDTNRDGVRMPPEGMTAYSIDTAAVEQDDDEVQVKQINQKIQQKAEDEFDLSSDQVRTEINYVNPVEQTDKQYIGSTRLTMRGPVETITKENGLNAWWLRKSEDMLVGDDDYNDGVVRRRALSKALFHASRVEGDPFNQVINHNDEDVAIVLGLGGGTGSGMFLDLAAELNRHVDRVHLYAIIPSLSEKVEPRANAHAALSELEYLTLTGQSPFKNIVLLPFEPTEEVASMDEFYDAMVNTIVAHQNFEADHWDAIEAGGGGFGPHRYAPFVLGMPQTLRYVVGDIQEARDTLKGFSRDRLEALETEHELYEALEKFVVEHVGGEAAENLQAELGGGNPVDNRFSLSVEEADELRDRLEDLRRMLELEQLEDLEYEAITEWRENLNDLIRAEEESLDDQAASHVEVNEAVVTSVPTIVEALEPVEERFPRDEANQLLDEYVRKELSAIRRRANLFRVGALIEDETLREGLRMALDEDIAAVAAGADLNREQDQLATDIDVVGENIDLLKDYIDDDLDPEIDDRVDRWRQEAVPIVEKLASLDRNQEELLSFLGDLEDAIQRAVTDINSADRVAALDTDPLEFRRFDEMNNRLREVDIEPLHEQDLRTSLQFAARAKEVWLEGQEKRDSFWTRLWLEYGFGDDADLADDYSRYRAQIDEELLSINDQYEPTFDFRCEYVGQDWFTDIREEIGGQRGELVNDLVQAFRNVVSDPAVSQEAFEDAIREAWKTTTSSGTPDELPNVSWPGDTEEYVDRLRAQFQGSIANVTPESFVEQLCAADDEGENNVVYLGVKQAVAGPVEQKRDTLQERKVDLEERKETYDRLIEINESKGAALADAGTEPRVPPIDFEGFVDSDYTYIKETSGENPNSLLHRNDIVDANISADERGTIIDTLVNDFAENVTNTDHRFPLDNAIIDARGSELEEPFYQEHQMISVYMSRMFRQSRQDLSDTFDEVEGRIREGLRLEPGDDGYMDRIVGFGGPWDLSMVTFLGGVFLDNIAPVTVDNGYYASYHEQRDTLREDVRVRHTQGLDGTDLDMVSKKGNGAYVYRDELLNLNRNEDRITVTNWQEEALINEFLDMEHVKEFESEFDVVGLVDVMSEGGSESAEETEESEEADEATDD